MLQLRDAEIIRDGGSYWVEVSEGTKCLCFLLQVRSWDKPEDRSYRSIFLGEESDMNTIRENGRCLSSGERKYWLEKLRVDIDVSDASENAQERYQEFLLNFASLD